MVPLIVRGPWIAAEETLAAFEALEATLIHLVGQVFADGFEAGDTSVWGE